MIPLGTDLQGTRAMLHPSCLRAGTEVGSASPGRKHATRCIVLTSAFKVRPAVCRGCTRVSHRCRSRSPQSRVRRLVRLCFDRSEPHGRKHAAGAVTSLATCARSRGHTLRMGQACLLGAVMPLLDPAPQVDVHQVQGSFGTCLGHSIVAFRSELQSTRCSNRAFHSPCSTTHPQRHRMAAPLLWLSGRHHCLQSPLISPGGARRQLSVRPHIPLGDVLAAIAPLPPRTAGGAFERAVRACSAPAQRLPLWRLACPMVRCVGDVGDWLCWEMARRRAKASHRA